MKTNFIISFEIYPFDVMVSINESRKQLEKSLKRYGINSADVDLGSKENGRSRNGRTVMFQGGQMCIRMFRPINTPEMAGALAHEIFHCVEFLMRRVNVKLCHKSDEAFAYAIGYLTSKIYEQL